jgi:serine/threonine-protein kinase
VSPSNLSVNSEGKLILSGFSTENERKRGTMLKSQLFSGCAAPEQYRNDNVLDIATDIYGFTATLFYALIYLNNG